jgi:CRP-like cAMP-binding protein
MKIFDDFLLRFVAYDQIAFEAFKALLSKEMLQIPKKDFIFKDGDKIDQLYFIVEGDLRGFYINDKGEEITSDILFAPLLFTDNYAYTNKITTRLNLQTLTTVSLYTIKLTELEIMITEYQTINSFFRLYFSFLFNVNNQRRLSYIYETSEERYLNLIKQHPKVIENIPQHYIASYLGIQPETLSRIRKKIMKNN